MRRYRLEHLGHDVHLYDSHCHLDILQDRYGTSMSDLSLPQQFRDCVANFCHPWQYRLAPGILRDPRTWGSVGLHPKFADSVCSSLLGEIEDLLNNPKVVAVGETGIDYF